MEQLEKKLDELIGIHTRGTLDRGFEQALGRILQSGPPLQRVSLQGLRYSNTATPQASQLAQPKDLLEIMTMQKEDLGLLKRQLTEMIDAFTTTLPLADRGEFASALLSGRVGFADKVQQSVYLLGVYTQSYIGRCMNTIDATMQVYPSGLEWLKRPQEGPVPGKP